MNIQQIAAARTALGAFAARPTALVGFDGFIDEIVHVVDIRKDSRNYTRIPTIAAYARRLAAAAGKSTNVEFVVQQVKMGGNGPLMSDALGRLGAHVISAGAFGAPVFNPVFEPLRAHGDALSITDPAVTIAAEFEDGKIMHGKLQTLSCIGFDSLCAAFGGRDATRERLREADILAMVNWTMIPNLTSVWRGLKTLAVELGDACPRFFFFDLCDPAKRSREDLREAVDVIASFTESKGTPIFGLNEKESAEVCAAVGVDYGDETPAGTLARARRLCEKTGIPEIVIHPHHFAAAAGCAGSGFAEGPYCAAPKLTTGAGDHFNGGYCFARLAGLPPELAIVAGKCVSGFYVREGRGPGFEEVLEFAQLWIDGRLDPWRPR